MLEARSVTKRYGGQTVLQNATFSVRPGEVVGLVGFNGAGKTTLLDVLCAKVQPDGGEVWADGKRFVPRSRFAGSPPVFRTYQVPRLFPRLSVADNVLLGRWTANGTCSPLPSLVGSHGNLSGDALSVGQRRRITLDHLYSRLAYIRYFLLDEPAAGADDDLTAAILEFVRTARKNGCGILLVEHRDAVLNGIADRTVYLSDGTLLDHAPQNGSQPRTAPVATPARAETPESAARPSLVARDLVVARGAATVLHGISFDARPGQVTVVTGQNGCGKSTLLRAIYGDPSCPVVEGSLNFEGRDLREMDLGQRIAQGVQLMPQDGTLFQSMTVEEALRVGVEAVDPTAWRPEATARLRAQLPILDLIWSRRCGLLSGGERRCVSFGRILLLQPEVALLDEPMAGIDSRGKGRIVKLIEALASTGAAVFVAEQESFVGLLPASKVFVLQPHKVSGTSIGGAPA